MSDAANASFFSISISSDTTSPSVSESGSRWPVEGEDVSTESSNISDPCVPEYTDNHDFYGSYEYTEYMYPGFSFERPVYLYLWEILVVLTSIANIIVVSILLRRKMRNPTNTILAAIAIADSLTGLVTLPTYIMVFQRFEAVGSHEYSNSPPNHTGPPPFYTNGATNLPSDCNWSISQAPFRGQMLPDSIESFQNGFLQYGAPKNFEDYDMSMAPSEASDGYVLTKELCRGFMISKYFLSKMFHTMSIFLTLFLAIQRFISVAFPFKSQNIFTIRKTGFCCLVICLISPAFHAFHLDNEKAMNGLCQWELAEEGCKGGCIYLWMMFFLRHFVPCVALITFTALFINELNRGEQNLRRMDSTSTQVSRRADENKRITIIVVAIVIVFLIPEVPYGAFLLYNAIDKTAYNGRNIDLETNRAIHMVYELLLVISFHANFYIYTFFNRRFRKALKKRFVYPVRRFFGDERRFSISTTSSFLKRITRKTDISLSKSGNELQTLNTKVSNAESRLSTDHSKSHGNIDQNGSAETPFMESFSGEIKRNPESSETDALNASV